MFPVFELEKDAVKNVEQAEPDGPEQERVDRNEAVRQPQQEFGITQVA